MNDLLKRIGNVLEKPKTIINSEKKSPSLNKSVVSMTMLAAALSPMMANAHIDNAHHVHYENIDVFGQSELVKDHIQNVKDKIGFSIDQGSDYLNYKHPLHSRINEFLEYAYDNYDEAEFQHVKELAINSQKNFDNGHYSNMDEYAHHLLQLTDPSPIIIVDYESETPTAETALTAGSTVELFNLMIDDPNFDFDNESFYLSESDFEFDRTAVSNRQKTEDYVLAFHSKAIKDTGDDIVTNLGVANWYANDMKPLETWGNPDNKDNSYVSRFYKELNQVFAKAFNLSELDQKLINQIGHGHEIAHLATPDELKGTAASEFFAEVLSTWNGIQSGGSEGYLQLRKEANTTAMAISPDRSVHDGYAYMETFLDQYSYDQIKQMSMNDMIRETTTFVDSLPNGFSFDQAAKETAKIDVLNKGAFPTVQSYLEKTQEHPNVLKTLKSVNDLVEDSSYVELVTTQKEIIDNENTSSLKQFMAKSFPTMFKEENTHYIDPDLNYRQEVLSTYNNHVKMYGQHETFNMNDYSFKNKTLFDTTEELVQLSDNLKATKDGYLLVKEDGFTKKVDIKIEAVTKINKDNLILYVDDNDYNEVAIKISKNGIETSKNGNEFKKATISDLQDLDTSLQFNTLFIEAMLDNHRELKQDSLDHELNADKEMKSMNLDDEYFNDAINALKQETVYNQNNDELTAKRNLNHKRKL